jgi:hypothetical protein
MIIIAVPAWIIVGIVDRERSKTSKKNETDTYPVCDCLVLFGGTVSVEGFLCIPQSLGVVRQNEKGYVLGLLSKISG